MSLVAEKCVPTHGKLENAEAKTLCMSLNGWEIDGIHLVKKMKFKDFVAALAYINQLGALAEEQGHHPDIAFGWGYATIRLTTHDAGGLTRNDFIVAAKIDALGE